MKLTEQQKYIYAKSKVKKLKAFYTHLTVYLIINGLFMTFKILRGMNHGESFTEAFLDASTGVLWMIWGIILILHAFSLFGLERLLGKNWEEKQIERDMDKNNNN